MKAIQGCTILGRSPIYVAVLIKSLVDTAKTAEQKDSYV